MTNEDRPPLDFASVLKAAAVVQRAMDASNRIALPEIDPADVAAVAQAVLWQFGDFQHGLRPGSFTEALLELAARADPVNRHRLARSFPLHAAFVEIAQQHDDGMRILAAFVEDERSGVYFQLRTAAGLERKEEG